MDTFAEQLVKRGKSSTDSVKKVLIIAATAVVFALLIGVTLMYIEFAVLVVIVFFGVGFGAYQLISGLYVEYEYCITNGEIDVDKITAKSRRKHLISVEVKSFEAFGKYESASEDFSGTTIMAAGGEEEAYYADFKSEEYGEARLVFSPDEKFMDCIKQYLPRNLRI